MSDTPSRPFRRWAARLAFLNLLAVMGVVAWFFTAADEHWLATLMLFGPRWIAFAPLAFVGPFALVTRSLWGLLCCAIAAVIIAWPFMGAVLNLSAIPDATSGTPLLFATFNADAKACDRAEFQAFVKEFSLDVVALQDADRILESDLPPGYTLVNSANGIKLASKQPRS
jgi:hypothetical protein